MTVDGMRVPIRVRTGASRPGVGGNYDGRLVVAVAARPVDGAANAAVLAAAAAAFGLRTADVTLVAGVTSRSKVLFLAGDPALLAARLRQLLAR